MIRSRGFGTPFGVLTWRRVISLLLSRYGYTLMVTFATAMLVSLQGLDPWSTASWPCRVPSLTADQCSSPSRVRKTFPFGFFRSDAEEVISFGFSHLDTPSPSFSLQFSPSLSFSLHLTSSTASPQVINALFGADPFDLSSRWSQPSLIGNLLIFVVRQPSIELGASACHPC